MNFEELFIEEKILSLSTRANILFANDPQYITISISTSKEYKYFWQVWFELNDEDGKIANKILEQSLCEAKNLDAALAQLDEWLNGKECLARRRIEQGVEIIESIGFGD